jgi:hypothetical protein
MAYVQRTCKPFCFSITYEHASQLHSCIPATCPCAHSYLTLQQQAHCCWPGRIICSIYSTTHRSGCMLPDPSCHTAFSTPADSHVVILSSCASTKTRHASSAQWRVWSIQQPGRKRHIWPAEVHLSHRVSFNIRALFWQCGSLLCLMQVMVCLCVASLLCHHGRTSSTVCCSLRLTLLVAAPYCSSGGSHVFCKERNASACVVCQLQADVPPADSVQRKCVRYVNWLPVGK